MSPAAGFPPGGRESGSELHTVRPNSAAATTVLKEGADSSRSMVRGVQAINIWCEELAGRGGGGTGGDGSHLSTATTTARSIAGPALAQRKHVKALTASGGSASSASAAMIRRVGRA